MHHGPTTSAAMSSADSDDGGAMNGIRHDNSDSNSRCVLAGGLLLMMHMAVLMGLLLVRLNNTILPIKIQD